MSGGGGDDTVSYATATAGVNVDLGTSGNQNTGGAGTDRITSMDNLTGSAFNDTLDGDNNANVINGGAGNDVIDGNGDDDTLIGGAGNDTLTGGSGNDDFVFGLGHGDDVVTDFFSTFNDLVLTGLFANAAAALAAFNTTTSVLTTSEGTITLTGVTSLVAGDIII